MTHLVRKAVRLSAADYEAAQRLSLMTGKSLGSVLGLVLHAALNHHVMEAVSHTPDLSSSPSRLNWGTDSW